MLTPQVIEGGERVQLLPEVSVQEQLVDGRIAFHAGRTAKKLLRLADTLPFVSVRDSNSEGVIDLAYLRTWEPGTYGDSDDQQTLWHPDNLKRVSPSFVKCVRALMDFANLEATDFIHLMFVPEYESLPGHQDLFDNKRALLTLMGFKNALFPVRELDIAYTSLGVGPGDAYDMAFTDSPETSIWHSVEYLGGENIIMYADSEYSTPKKG